VDTTEHDAAGGDGITSPGGKVSLPAGDGKGDVSLAETDASRRYSAQLLSIAFASAVVGAVTWFSFKIGYETEKGEGVVPPMPGEFSIPIVGAILVGFVAPLWVELRDGIAKGLVDSEPSAKPLPGRLLGTLVYVLTGGVVFALVSLVTLTGGFADSPFTPVMTAPAALGPFMARKPKTIAELTAVGIASVWASIYLIDRSSLGLEPEPWVAGLMATSMLFIAGVLSYLRHRRDKKWRDEVGWALETRP
jgi:hypothetical protein